MTKGHTGHSKKPAGPCAACGKPITDKTFTRVGPNDYHDACWWDKHPEEGKDHGR